VAIRRGPLAVDPAMLAAFPSVLLVAAARAPVVRGLLVLPALALVPIVPGLVFLDVPVLVALLRNVPIPVALLPTEHVPVVVALPVARSVVSLRIPAVGVPVGHGVPGRRGAERLGDQLVAVDGPVVGPAGRPVRNRRRGPRDVTHDG
jgi:hypothetical protein